MRLTKEARERLEGLTVRLLLELRRAYLQTPAANALKQWDLLETRMLAAARTSAGVEEWVTTVMRRLCIVSPPNSLSGAICDLRRAVDEHAPRPTAWLDLIEREHAYLVASARVLVEQRKAYREAHPDEPHDEDFAGTSETVVQQ